ncbi:MAG TPA: hypothetical protein VNI01_11995, partial [Elusimicrobiota bacterium]|nr:hypothetical protein [Elusimicrobiota bacterium]
MTGNSRLSTGALRRLVGGLLPAALTFSLLRPVTGIDLWTYLAAGELVARTGRAPALDVFSWTCAGRTWIDHEWLLQLGAYGAYRASGLGAIIALKAALILLAFLFLELRLRRADVSAPWRACVFVAAALACRHTWWERADLASLALTSALLWSLERGPSALAPWPFLFAVWANMHGGFLLGLGLLAAFAAGDAARRREPPRALLAWGALCALATLLNPYGPALHAALLRWSATLKDGLIYEWGPPPWEGFRLFWACLAACGAAALWSPHASDPRMAGRLESAAVCVLLGALAARHQRFVPFFMVCALPYAACAWRRTRAGAAAARLIERRERPLLLGALGLSAAAALGAARGIQGGVDQEKAYWTDGAYRFVVDRAIPGPFYNDYSLGSGWMWRVKGSPPVFLDGRFSTVDGYEKLVHESLAAQADPARWDPFLEERGARAALLRYAVRPAPLSRYFPRERWALVYWDD